MEQKGVYQLAGTETVPRCAISPSGFHQWMVVHSRPGSDGGQVADVVGCQWCVTGVTGMAAVLERLVLAPEEPVG